MEKKTVTRASQASNPEFAAQAEAAVRDRKFVSVSGRCQQFLRQNVQKRYGNKYDRFHKESATKSMNAWKNSEFAVDPARGSVVGDILYKGPTKGNPHGHVGIRVVGNRVAENSSTSRGRVNGAKGFRTLAEFGKVDLIVRLPRAKK